MYSVYINVIYVYFTIFILTLRHFLSGLSSPTGAGRSFPTNDQFDPDYLHNADSKLLVQAMHSYAHAAQYYMQVCAISVPSSQKSLLLQIFLSKQKYCMQYVFPSLSFPFSLFSPPFPLLFSLLSSLSLSLTLTIWYNYFTVGWTRLTMPNKTNHNHYQVLKQMSVI